MTRIACCTTIAPYILDKEDQYWDRWMFNAAQVRAATNAEIDYFAAIEVDARGLQPYRDSGFLKMLESIGGGYWSFSLNDGSTEYHTNTRLVRITTGQNLTGHFAMMTHADWLCFLAADTEIPDNGMQAMLDMNWPVGGLNVPTYCFKGPRVTHDWEGNAYPADWNIQEHINSAACLMIRRDVFTTIKFRTDLDRHFSDDPAYHADCIELLGIQMRSRHDIQAKHYPECIGAIETRHDDREIRA